MSWILEESWNISLSSLEAEEQENLPPHWQNDIQKAARGSPFKAGIGGKGLSAPHPHPHPGRYIMLEDFTSDREAKVKMPKYEEFIIWST